MLWNGRMTAQNCHFLWYLEERGSLNIEKERLCFINLLFMVAIGIEHDFYLIWLLPGK